VNVPGAEVPGAAEPGVIAICGGGLIGASMALALRDVGHAVHIHDRDPAVRAALRSVLGDRSPAAEAPIGTGGATVDVTVDVTVHETWAAAAAGAAVVVAAVPPPAIPEVLVEAAGVAHPEALLTDVAGVKQRIVDAVNIALEPSTAVRYVGGHPMAGSERSGPEAGDATLFSGATWVLTPTDATSDGSLARASELARGLGARVLVLSPEEHDVIVGLVSHLPQLVASVLADVAAEAVGAERDAVMAVAGPGFRDTTRIAASDPALWLDIVDGNRDAILAALQRFDDRLGDVRTAVERSDASALGAILRRASEARRRLLPKGIEAPTRDLLVPLRDRPGAIARITGALGSAGINIEDLSMRHATDADRGSLLLRVRAETVARALDVLDAADFTGVVVPEQDAPSATGTGG